MSEDQFLIVGSKSLVASLVGGKDLGGGRRVATLHNDISLDAIKGTSEGGGDSRRQGEMRKLVNPVETWKTHDEINFVKSADVTHFLDFGDLVKDRSDCLGQKEMLCVTASHEDAAPGQGDHTSGQPFDSVAEQAVTYTLIHGGTVQVDPILTPG